jgi:hypothetical protein
MTYNFETKQPYTDCGYNRGIRRRAIIMFLALKQSLGGHTFEGDREVEAVVTQWTITQDTDFHQWKV